MSTRVSLLSSSSVKRDLLCVKRDLLCACVHACLFAFVKRLSLVLFTLVIGFVYDCHWFCLRLSGLFELACWKLKVVTGEWERKDPPKGFTWSTAVDWEANPPTVKCTTDTFSPYSIRATRKNVQQQALFFFFKGKSLDIRVRPSPVSEKYSL